MTKSISILIVDDHAIVRQGVSAFLNAQPDLQVLGEAENGTRAVELAAELAPDVTLMDLSMPGMDGVEATRQIRRISPHTQVIVLTSYHEDEYIFPALRAGAISYLLKSVNMDELAEAIRRAAQGEASLHSRVAARVVQEIHGARRENANPYTELTERELQTLKLIAAGMSNQQIADQLVISENTVKGYVSNILAKLHLADRTQAAIYAWREGVVRGKQD
jgi:NarL family two-component system response regulator LiaR